MSTEEWAWLAEIEKDAMEGITPKEDDKWASMSEYQGDEVQKWLRAEYAKIIHLTKTIHLMRSALEEISKHLPTHKLPMSQYDDPKKLLIAPLIPIPNIAQDVLDKCSKGFDDES